MPPNTSRDNATGHSDDLWVHPEHLIDDQLGDDHVLASIEDIFNLRHLGYASQSGLAPLDAGTFDGLGPSGGCLPRGCAIAGAQSRPPRP